MKLCSIKYCPIPVFTRWRRIEAGPCPLHSYLFRRERLARHRKGSKCDVCGIRIEYSFEVCETCCEENGHEFDFEEGGMCLHCGNAEGYERMADAGDYLEDR